MLAMVHPHGTGCLEGHKRNRGGGEKKGSGGISVVESKRIRIHRILLLHGANCVFLRMYVLGRYKVS